MRAVIFDMDGLMIDSERLITEEMVKSGEKRGYKDIRICCERSTGVTGQETKKMFIEHFGEDFPYDEIIEIAKENYLKRLEKDGISIKKGLFEILEYLKENKYLLAVATSTREVTALKNLERINAKHYFDKIICGDKVSHSKPHPEIYLKAAEMLGVSPEECYVLEDSHNGIKSAFAAGMKPIMVPDLLPYNDHIKLYVFKKCDNLIEAIDVIKSDEKN